MLKEVRNIIKAQDCLIKKYGEKDYKRLISKIKEKTKDNPIVLLAMYNDNSLDSIIRLGAFACLGE